jgi:outer membrane receptor protein involved in Fe transport
MVYAPAAQSGSFFNDQEREVQTLQWVQALSFTRNWGGQHVLKFGLDLQRSHFDGTSVSRPIEVRRLDGSLAERTVFHGPTSQQISGYELAFFAQDRWRAGSRVTFEGGLRGDRDAIIRRFNWSPRAGVAIAVQSEGRAIIRGGYGRFVQRTPLNVEAFPSFQWREVTRFDLVGEPVVPAVRYLHRLDPNLKTARAHVGNVEWNQRFTRRFLLKFAFLHRNGAHEPILRLRPEASELLLESEGASRYQEFEATARYLGGERRDLTLSYVWAKGEADLNDFDQFFGNFRNPILRQNEYSLMPTDVRHRILLRGTIGLPGQWDLAPVIELRSGFPWTAVDEFQDFVDPRNRTDRLPAVHTVDFSLSRPWTIKKYRVRLGVKFYNLFGTSAGRDVQHNITAPDYGEYYNPLERSIGFVFKLLK